MVAAVRSRALPISMAVFSSPMSFFCGSLRFPASNASLQVRVEQATASTSLTEAEQMAQDLMTCKLIAVGGGAVIVRIQAKQGAGYINSEIWVAETYTELIYTIQVDEAI